MSDPRLPGASQSTGSGSAYRASLSSSVLELYGDFSVPSRFNGRDFIFRVKRFFRKQVYGCDLPWRKCLLTVFPLAAQLRNYRLATVKWDILAGLIVGMIQFTQVFGNAFTASLKPYAGTFFLLFPGLLYALMSTSPHNSLGGMPVIAATLSVSFMTIQDAYYPNQIRDGKLMTDSEQLDLHFLMAPGIAFVAGCIQIGLGVFKLGFLSAVLSPTVMQPFAIACVLQSICGKLPTALGIPRLVYFHYGKHFRDTIFMFRNLDKVNGWEALLSFSMASLVLAFREYLQPKIFQRMKIVVPIEFMLFVICSGLTYSLRLESRFGVKVVGPYSYGFQRPSVPDFTFAWEMAFAGLVLAIVTYSVTLDTAKVLARKYGDQISPNQELLALGSAQVFGSFFSCIPVAAPVGRGTVKQAMGSRSQLSTLVACLFAGLVVQFGGPGIAHLPLCIIATNMILFLSMSLGGFSEVPRLWRNNKTDASVWILTFIGCVALTVQIGLFLGIGLSLLILIMRSQRPKVKVMAILKNTNWGFVAAKQYDTTQARELPGVRVLQIQSPISYANAEFLVKQVAVLAWEEYEASVEFPTIGRINTVKPLKRYSSLVTLTARQNPAIRALTSSNTLGSLMRSGSPMTGRGRGETNRGISISLTDLSEHSSDREAKSEAEAESSEADSDATEITTASRVILDLGGVGYVDAVGVRALQQIASDLTRLSIETFLAQCTGPLLKQLKHLEVHKIIPEKNIFPSVVDAAEEAIRRIRGNTDAGQGGEVVEEYEDDRFWDVPVVPVEGLPVVDLDKVDYDN